MNKIWFKFTCEKEQIYVNDSIRSAVSHLNNMLRKNGHYRLFGPSKSSNKWDVIVGASLTTMSLSRNEPYYLYRASRQTIGGVYSLSRLLPL